MLHGIGVVVAVIVVVIVIVGMIVRSVVDGAAVAVISALILRTV